MSRHPTKRVAEAYGRHSQNYVSVLEPVMAPMADEIARMAQLGAERVALDLATGTGLIARALERAIEFVVGVDLSPGILRIASAQSGGSIPLAVGDALQLPFRDHCFELVACGVSLSHFAKTEAALREVCRLLRPGGRLIASAWANEGENRTKSAAVEVRRKYLEAREATLGQDFQEELWADPQRGRRALTQAGFVGVQVATLPISGRYTSHSTAVEAAFAWPLTRYRISKLSEADQASLRQETESAIRQIDDLRWRTDVHYYEAVRSSEA
jgi:SAM-dependent methyltransferase